MSEDNTTVVVTETETQVHRGDRGEVGVATPALTLKARWHKDLLSKKTERLSLKAFARKLVKEGDLVAEEWLANKAGENNQKRSAANAQLAKTCAGATKLSRKKSKSGGGKAKATTTEA